MPCALYDLDEHQSDTELVMSRTEAHALFARLRVALIPAQTGGTREAAR
ncbi:MULTISPECIES: hypothetical protein [unclassified Streptomyces]|nr:hypothetical protein [Streptomyces sp. A13(2022)]MCU8589908.1 hypothetical protein [Streptomyces sp. A13(2022)]